jgi:hypothetical protein
MGERSSVGLWKKEELKVKSQKSSPPKSFVKQGVLLILDDFNLL